MQKIVSKIPRRDKKSFFNERCIDIEENNRRGMTRDFFRKIGNIKGTLHPKMCPKKDRNGRALVDADEIKERCLRVLLLLLLSCFSRVRLCATPQRAAHQAPPSLGFSRQEHWSGLPFPSPMHENEK